MNEYLYGEHKNNEIWDGQRQVEIWGGYKSMFYFSWCRSLANQITNHWKWHKDQSWGMKWASDYEGHLEQFIFHSIIKNRYVFLMKWPWQNWCRLFSESVANAGSMNTCWRLLASVCDHNPVSYDIGYTAGVSDSTAFLFISVMCCKVVSIR